MAASAITSAGSPSSASSLEHRMSSAHQQVIIEAFSADDPFYAKQDVQFILGQFPTMDLVKELGRGTFATAFQVKIEDKDAVLRVLSYQKVFHHPKICNLSADRAGGEWLAFFLDGDHMVKTTHIIAFNPLTNTHLSISREEFLEYYRLKQEGPEARLKENPIFQLLNSGFITAIATVAEYYEGSEELFCYIKKSESYMEKERVKMLVPPLIKAIGELHKRVPGLTHRDIKLENLLIQAPSKAWPQGRLLLLDTGLSRILPRGIKRFSIVGTPQYAAYEILRDMAKDMLGEYDHRVDSYSLFCTLYTMTTHSFPIKEPMLKQMIEKSTFQRDNPLTDGIDPRNPQHKKLKETLIERGSPMADDDAFIDLMVRLGQIVQDKRLSVIDAANHPWVAGSEKSSDEASSSGT